MEKLLLALMATIAIILLVLIFYIPYIISADKKCKEIGYPVGVVTYDLKVYCTNALESKAL